MIDYESEVPAPSQEQLETINNFVRMQLQRQQEVEDAENVLAAAKKRLRQIQEIDLPSAMEAAGCSEFKTKEGLKVSIKKDISASLSEGKKPAAIEWLLRNGHSEIVKTDVIIPFDRTESDSAQVAELTSYLQSAGYAFTSKNDVNTATLKALIRELRENGVDVPLETLGAFEWKKAIVKV